MNRTMLSVVALAVGAVLIIGLYNIYTPQVHGMTHDVFDKIHIQRMVGDGPSHTHNSNHDNHANQNNNQRTYGTIIAHMMDTTNDPQGAHLKSDPEVMPSSQEMHADRSTGTPFNAYDAFQNNVPNSGIKGHTWTRTGPIDTNGVTSYNKGTQDIYIGVHPTGDAFSNINA